MQWKYSTRTYLSSRKMFCRVSGACILIKCRHPFTSVSIRVYSMPELSPYQMHTAFNIRQELETPLISFSFTAALSKEVSCPFVRGHGQSSSSFVYITYCIVLVYFIVLTPLYSIRSPYPFLTLHSKFQSFFLSLSLFLLGHVFDLLVWSRTLHTNQMNIWLVIYL